MTRGSPRSLISAITFYKEAKQYILIKAVVRLERILHLQLEPDRRVADRKDERNNTKV